ncbi:MAG: hypothetical protein HC817_01105, partial [Saprospiraceae bacterium]|nr:hypothetical protein [Saprospiraceae bacterium]
MKRKVEILVLSDIHLGTKNCKATELLTYLKSIKPNIIILNGNFIETKNFKNLVGDHLRVFGRLVKLLTQGSRIYYLSGEIDAPLRRFADFSNGQLFLRDQLVLKLGGKKYWFLHGNLLIPPQYPDDSWSSRKLVQWFFNRFFSKNTLQNRNFEQRVTEIAMEEGYDTVVCGYTRTPKMDNINGVEYFNAGDWTNHLTA